MMFNVPVIGGSTGHAVGATVIAIILGPWAAVIAISIALVIQAGLFGDGGITAIAANCFNMAVVAPFVGYYLYRLISGDAPSSGRRVVAAGVAAYVALVAAAIVAGVEFGIQPYLAHTATGQALYAPYRLGVAVPAMALEHLLFFGFVEAIVTMGIVAALAKSEPELLEMKPAAKPLRWLWAGMGVLILLTPIGVLAPGTAWGEWGGEELDALVGYVPANLEKARWALEGGHARLRYPGGEQHHARLPHRGHRGHGALRRHRLGCGRAARAASGRRGRFRRGGIAGSAGGSGRVSSPRPCCRPDIAPAIPRRRGGGRSLARKTADSISHAVTDVLQNEETAARPGLLQRLDSRVKLLTLVLFAVTASLVHSVWVLIALVGVTIVLAAASRVGVASFERKVWFSAGLLAFLVAAPSALQVFTPGPVVVPLGPLSLTEPGLMGVATLVTRVVASAGFALLIVWTMRWSDLLKALSAMRLPDVVVATLAMTQKQILTLLRTVEQIHLARESRTLTRGSARADRAWVTERMAFVVRKSMKTADDVYDAMLSRGFTGAMPSLVKLRLQPRDWAWSVASIALCAAILSVDRLVGPR